MAKVARVAQGIAPTLLVSICISAKVTECAREARQGLFGGVCGCLRGDLQVF